MATRTPSRNDGVVFCFRQSIVIPSGLETAESHILKRPCGLAQ